MDARQIALETALETAISEELARLTTGAGTEADRAQALASLVVLLGQLGPDTPTPAPVIELAPTLVEYVKSDPDLHVKHNATALLTGLLGTDEAVWKSLVIDSNVLVPLLVEALASVAADDTAGAVNYTAALTAAAQGGEEGAQSVINADGLPAIISVACSPAAPLQLQEAGADALCQLATYESCRELMSAAGCVAALANLLPSSSSEVRIRALMGLAMLLPSSVPNQKVLAGDAVALGALMASIRQSEDTDAKVVAQQLFTLLASNEETKAVMGATIRAAAEASQAEAAAAAGGQ